MLREQPKNDVGFFYSERLHVISSTDSREKENQREFDQIRVKNPL